MPTQSPQSSPQTYTSTATISGSVISSGQLTSNRTSFVSSQFSSVSAVKDATLLKMCMRDNAIVVVLRGEENGKVLELRFAPDSSINTVDLAKVMMLLTFMTNGGFVTAIDVMAYVRSNNLERHFDISEKSDKA